MYVLWCSALGTRQYIDGQHDGVLSQLRELERAMEKGMKNELKRFEKDVMIFLEDRSHELTESAVGKIHFRCISCDQYTNTVTGPSTLLFQKAVGLPQPVREG